MYKYVKYITVFLAFTAPLVALAEPAVTTSTNDPMVMKVYPDGTKIVVRWSEIGKAVDNGEKHGGAPRIIAYDPGKDGIVPIGQPSATSTAAQPPSAPLPSTSSVVMTESPSTVGNTTSPMSDTDDYGPMEGFGFRSNVGVAFQQTQSGRTKVDEGTKYQSVTFQPGIRFDIEPFYNVTDWFSVGVESAFIYNQIHSNQTDNNTIYSRSPALGSGALYQVPILANVRFQFPSDGPFRGFCGGGVGGVWDYSTLSVNTTEDGPQNLTNYQWNYAFQLVAGFSYNVAPGLDLETSFKTLCTPNPVGQNNTDGSVFGDGQVNAAYSYAAEVGLVWRF
jgi:opacity protein-like surface antigen